MIRNTLLVAAALAGLSSLALAAEPGPAADPIWTVLKASTLDVYGADGKATLNLHEGKGTRSLKIGDVYADGWILTGLTPATASFTKAGATAEVALPAPRAATRLARPEDEVETFEDATACAHAQAALNGNRINEARMLVGLQPLGPDQIAQPEGKWTYEMMVPKDDFLSVYGYTVAQKKDGQVVWYRTPQYAFDDGALDPIPTAPAKVLSCPAG